MKGFKLRVISIYLLIFVCIWRRPKHILIIML